MGELLALGSGVFFSFSVLYLKVGQNQRPNENGIFMTSLVNLVMYAVLTVGALAVGQLPAVTLAGFVFFVLAGFTNTLFGRWAWLQSVRAIGPSRGTALKVTAPVFAATLAFVFLDQPLTAPMVLGILVVIASVVVLSQEASPPSTSESPVEVATAVELSRARRLRQWASPRLAQGVLVGLLSAVAYAMGSVLRAMGLGAVPSPFFGALVGSVVAVGAVLASDAARGNLGRRWDDNIRSVPVPFVVAGVFAGVAQLCAFGALLYTTVAVSSTISSTQPLFTALLSVLFFRNLEIVTTRSVVGMGGICLGVAIVLFAR